MAPHARQQGFSLIEIMISMVIGLVLLAGVVQTFVSSRQSSHLNTAIADTQEIGRFALEYMTRDTRMAGFNPLYESCGGALNLAREADLNATGELANGRLRITLNDPEDYIDNYLSLLGAVTATGGYDATGDNVWTPALPTDISDLKPLSKSDVLVVRTGAASASAGGVTVTAHPGGNPPGSADVQVASGSNIKAGDVVLVVDKSCSSGAVFQVTGGNSTNLPHNTGTGTPGNRTKAIGRDMTGGFVYGGVGASDTIVYYVAANAFGTGTLYRRVNSTAPQLLADGIENMQVLYGEDTDGDDIVDAYVNAAGVGQWNRVVAVRVRLLVASPGKQALSASTPQTIAFLDPANPTVYKDGRLRQVFTSTIALRNRLP